MKYQSLFIFYFKIRISTSIITVHEPNVIKKPKYHQYYLYFIVWILVLYAFIISPAFRGAALIRKEALISMWVLIRGRCLFEALRLSEEIQ